MEIVLKVAQKIGKISTATGAQRIFAQITHRNLFCKHKGYGHHLPPLRDEAKALEQGPYEIPFYLKYLFVRLGSVSLAQLSPCKFAASFPASSHARAHAP